MRIASCLVTLVLLGAPCGAAAGVAEDVAAVRDGEIRLTYPAREGVRGDGHTLSIGNGDRIWLQNGRRSRELTNGPVRVSVTKQGGAVLDIEVSVGGAWRGHGDDIVDLGWVDPVEAAATLLEAARDASSGRRDHFAEEAICAAVIAQGAVVWPELLSMARERDASGEVRKRAAFWLANEAGEAVLRGHDDLERDDPEIEVREQAIFAVSQRPKRESIPVLLDIARNHSDPRLRRRAIFWLGQEADSRAVELFASILRDE